MQGPERPGGEDQEVNALAKADSTALKRRLAGLNANQRALLVRRLGEGESNVIRKARPLHVEERPRVSVYPASHGQQRMWFLHHYAPESPVYSVPSAFHLVGRLNVAWLEAAFRAVIQRHDMLRTSFAMENGELFQRVAVSSDFQLQQLSLEGIPADTRKASAESRLAEEACRPFDLAAGSPLRALLVRLQPGEHVLLLVWHHIVADGWSRSNFYRELSEAYQALATGRPAPIRRLPVQFADYSAWQKDWLEGGALETQTAYWKAKLAGEPEPLDLPSDRARPATESFRGACCSWRLDPELTAALNTRAQEEGATLFMILLAAFKVLLHRYTGQDDVSVGVPIANRRLVEVEELIGFFANTLVMRTTFSTALTFRELLRRVKDTAVEAYANQDMRFERLVEVLQVRRDASRTPLFQATFAMDDVPAVVLELPGIQAEPWFVTSHTAKFDVSLSIERSADGWMATAEYSTDLFAAGRVERMLEHLCVILESVASNPAQRVSDIPLLTVAERQQILVDWNQTERNYPRDKCVHTLFEEQAKRTPAAVAVVFEGHALNYRELDARASHLAHHLRSLGVGPDVLVGLCVERSLEVVVGLLGILKAGGAYVPLDPRYPKERIEFILQDAAAAVLVTQRALNVGQGVAHLVYLDEAIPPGVGSPVKSRVTPANLAYVIYTSGSTGRPKGVAIEHQSTVSFLHWVRESFSGAELSGVLASTSICFDLSVFEMFGPLSWGGRVVLVKNALDLWSPGTAKDVVLVNTVPSVLAELLQGRGLPPSVRTVNVCGEPLHQSLVEATFKRTSAEHVNDLYGPSETTTYSTYGRREVGGVDSVGRPIANTQIYILDARGQPVPVGIPGELHIGGIGVARGYLRKPGLTSERFVGDPFSGRPADRLFKTGDRARWLPDGTVALLGRGDGQVKVRGFRIELGEIEAALRKRPEVRAVTVSVREDTPGDRRLVAYLVAQAGEKPDGSTLRTRLAEILPEYMLPNAFVWLDQLPLTANGKLDYRALPRPDEAQRTAGARVVAPRTDIERELIAIWEAVLGRRGVGVTDDFFDLGGHSLLALRLFDRVERAFGKRLPLASLFQAPTIECLARLIALADADAEWSSLVAIRPEGNKPPIFFVHGVGGDVLIFRDLAELLGPDQPVYGLRAQGLDGHRQRHERVEEMAEAYVREIQALRPKGPYLLAGQSFGGLVVYEMAQRLVAAGQDVRMLALLDTYGPGYRTFPSSLHRAESHLRNVWNLALPKKVEYVKIRVRAARTLLTRRLWRAADRTLRAFGQSMPRAVENAEGTHYLRALRMYEIRPYPGMITLFRAEEQPVGLRADPYLGWGPLAASGVDVYEVPGSHEGHLFQPHVVKVAEAMRTALDKIREDGSCSR
jgi:amino acid adenylation domain-containing protein